MKLFLYSVLFFWSHQANSVDLLIDRAGLLDSLEGVMLSSKLQDFSDTSGIRFQIVIDTDHQVYSSIDDQSAWIIIGLQDRVSRIEIPKGLRSGLSDDEIERIRTEYLVENLRNSRYFEGLDQSSSILMMRLTENLHQTDHDFGNEILMGLAVILLLILSWWLFRKN